MLPKQVYLSQKLTLEKLYKRVNNIVPESPSDKPALNPPLRPPGAPAQTAAVTAVADGGSSAKWLWVGLCVSALLIVFVIFVLPYLVASPSGEPEQIIQIPTNAQQPSTNLSVIAEANKAAEEYLKLIAELTLINADNWGDERWQQADTLASKANTLFTERRFSSAIKHYAQASETLVQLQADRENLLSDTLNQAGIALEDQKIKKAREKFERALVIDDSSQVAQEGLKSTNVRKEVLALMIKAKQAEKNAEFRTAQVVYREILALDDNYLLATQRLKNVTLKISQDRFRTLMSKALSALDKNKISTARKALSKAKKLKPNDPALRDAIKRLSLVSQQNVLDDMRAQTKVNVQQEDWQTAIDTYKKALKIESNAAFATTGLSYARQQLSKNRQFDNYISTPTRLYSPEPLVNAQRLINTAEIDASTEPKLFAKYSLLKEYVTQALVPLPLTLHSDANTDIVIYHVGKFGRFKKRQLNLKPGKYTVVGVRSGYRDVRKIVSLLPGQKAPIIEVRCEEKI